MVVLNLNGGNTMEKRKVIRCHINSKVNIKYSSNTNKNWQSAIIDISVHGIAFEINDKLSEGAVVELNFPPFAATVKATIKRVSSKINSYVHGAQFKDLSFIDQNMLYNIIQSSLT